MLIKVGFEGTVQGDMTRLPFRMQGCVKLVEIMGRKAQSRYCDEWPQPIYQKFTVVFCLENHSSSSYRDPA